MQQTFCLLKSESYIFSKNTIIEQKIKKSGLKISERWKVRLSFGDIFKLYNGWIPRLASLMRFPPLFKLDMYIIEGNDAVSRMYNFRGWCIASDEYNLVLQKVFIVIQTKQKIIKRRYIK